MKKKLKVDSRFTPCPTDDGDELYPNGIFIFNITKMTDYLLNSSIKCEEVPVVEFNACSSKLNEAHLATVDVSIPVIIAEISPGRYNVIDGNHRMEKARRLGIEKIRAYKLSPEHHLQFLTTERAYFAFIEYWNDKLKKFR